MARQVGLDVRDHVHRSAQRGTTDTSEATDWTLIVRGSQKAQIAAEAALEITGRLKLEIGLRLDGLEGRLGTLEGRAASLAAGQDSLHRAVLRIADTLIDHSARFDAIDKNLADIAARLP